MNEKNWHLDKPFYMAQFAKILDVLDERKLAPVCLISIDNNINGQIITIANLDGETLTIDSIDALLARMVLSGPGKETTYRVALDYGKPMNN